MKTDFTYEDQDGLMQLLGAANGEDLSHKTSSLACRPVQRIDYANTDVAKPKHTIHTNRRKETNTGMRQKETRTTCT